MYGKTTRKERVVINTVVLVGRLATDVEMKYTSDGVPLASFRIAVDRRFKEGADFFTVNCWRKQAEFADKFLFKGRLVGIEGSLEERTWTDDDGNRKSMVRVQAESVQALDSKKDGPDVPFIPEVKDEFEGVDPFGE